jgi:putative transcriptional regulator
MQDLKGCILKSTPALNSSYFERALIFITEHNSKGAIGFVINKLFERKLNELEEFSHAAAIDIYEGGPVDKGHLYFLHAPSAIIGGEQINKNIFLGGDFQKQSHC